jgi:chromosome partitioning protein
MIITVASFKGGVAKTTTAVHLAAYFQQKTDTLLIDSDPNRSATGWAKRRGELPFKVVDEHVAAKFVGNYTSIVIDTPARPTQEDLEALAEGCDYVVLPSTPDTLSLDALIQTVDCLKNLNSERFKILLTIVPPFPSRDGEEARKMLEAANLPVFKSQVKRLVVFQKAALEGVPVYNVKDPKAMTAWRDYRSVGEEIIEL